MHAGILISESDILIPESRKAQSGEPHTSYLSIVAHHHNIEACKSTPKSAQTRDKIAKIGKNVAFSMLKNTPA